MNAGWRTNEERVTLTLHQSHPTLAKATNFLAFLGEEYQCGILWSPVRLRNRDKALGRTPFMPPHQEVLEEAVGEIPGYLVCASPTNLHEDTQRGGLLAYHKHNLGPAFQHNHTFHIVRGGAKVIQDNDTGSKFSFMGKTFALGLGQPLLSFYFCLGILGGIS